MYDDFSPAVQRAILAAAAWTGRHGGPGVGSVHLLLGMLEDEDGRAWALLSQHGLPLPACRDRWAELPAAESPPLSEVLTHANEMSRRHGEDATVTSDFFLLAILRTDTTLT